MVEELDRLEGIPRGSRALFLKIHHAVKLVDYLGFGPLAPNVGLLHTVSSAADPVNVSFLSTQEFLGDGSAYNAALLQSWEELALL